MSKRTWGVLALILAMVFWGPAPVMTKLGIREISPYSLAFFRFVLALALMLPFFFLKGHHLISRGDIGRVLLVGLFGSGLNTLFFMSGIQYTSATSAAAIFATVPLVNAVAAAVVLREKPTLIRIMGVLIGFLGSILIALGPTLWGNGGLGGDIWGNLLIGGAVFSWVGYIIFSKELLKKYSPLTITTYSFLVGSLLVLPLSLFEMITHPFWYQQITQIGLSAVVYGGILASVVPFMLYQWGMKQTSAFEAGIVTYLNPPLAAIFAIPILEEWPTPIFLVGTSLILGGVFLATTYELIQKRREK